MSLGVNITKKLTSRRRVLSLIPRGFNFPSATGDGPFWICARCQHAAASAQPVTTPEHTSSTFGEAFARAPPLESRRTRKTTLSASKALIAKHRAERRTLENSIARHRLDNAALIRPHFIYRSRRQTDRDRQRHHRSVKRQEGNERHRQESLAKLDERQRKKRAAPDWRKVLLHLVFNTPKYAPEWHEDALRVILSPSLVKQIKAGGDEGIHALSRRTGAHIKLFERDQPNEWSSLLLSGSTMGMDRVVEAVKRMQTSTPDHQPIVVTKVSPTRINREQLGGPPITPTDAALEGTTSKSKRAPWVLDYHVRKVHQPREWSKDTFLRHIDALTNAVVPPELVSRIYGSQGHESATIKLLLELLQDEENRPFVSSATLKLVLKYLAVHGVRHRDAMIALLQFARRARLPLEADVMVIPLREATRSRDLAYFDSLLRATSLQTDVQMLIDIWIHFLRLVEDEEVKRQVLLAMHHKNLLQAPGAMRRVAIELSLFDALRAAASNLTLESFLEEQEVRYGRNWLTRNAGGRVLDGFGRYGKFEHCQDFIEYQFKFAAEMGNAEKAARQDDSDNGGMRAPNLSITPGLVHFNTVLTHAKILGLPHKAVPVLQRMERSANSQPDVITYHLLFEAAWKARLPTVLQVIWMHASVREMTSYRMRRFVSKLLSGKMSQDVAIKIAPFLSGDFLERIESGKRPVPAVLPAPPNTMSADVETHPVAAVQVPRDSLQTGDQSQTNEQFGMIPVPNRGRDIRAHKLGVKASRATRDKYASKKLGSFAEQYRKALEYDLRLHKEIKMHDRRHLDPPEDEELEAKDAGSKLHSSLLDGGRKQGDYEQLRQILDEDLEMPTHD